MPKYKPGKPRAVGPGEPERGPARWGGLQYRVVAIDEDGRGVAHLFETKAKAQNFADVINAGVRQTERTVHEAIPAYHEHLIGKGNKAESIKRTLWSLTNMFPTDVALARITVDRAKTLYTDLRTRPIVITRRVMVCGDCAAELNVRRRRCDCGSRNLTAIERVIEGEPLAADSHRAALRETKTFFRWIVGEKKWLAESPFEKVQGVGKCRPRGKSLGKAGIRLRIREARAWYHAARRMAAVCNSHGVIALTALFTGARSSEIVKRRIRDLDTEELDGDTLQIEERKNGEDLSVAIDDPLRTILLYVAAGRGELEPLFVNPETGKRYRRWFVRAAAHAVSDAAGVPRITAHAMRGLLATLKARQGSTAEEIAAQLGNTPEVAAEKYVAPGALGVGARRAGLAVLQGGKR